MSHRDLHPSETAVNREASYGIAQASIIADVRSLLSAWRRSEQAEEEALRLIAARVGYYLAEPRSGPSKADQLCSLIEKAHDQSYSDEWIGNGFRAFVSAAGRPTEGET